MTSIRQKLSVTLLVWLAVVLGLFCVVVFLLVRQSLLGDVDQFVRDKAYLLGAQVNPWFPAGMAVDEKPWRSDRYVAFGQTLDTNWNILFTSLRLAASIPPTEELKRLASHPVGVVHHDAVGPDGARYRMATVRIERQGKLVCFSQIGVLMRERDKPLWQLTGWLAGCAVAAFGLAWLGLDYVLRQWGAPLATFAESARAVRLETLSRQRLFAPPEAPELAQLAATFNELLDRVEAVHASQHRFVADASHELRTPLTILRGEMDVVLRRPRSAEEYAEVLHSSREEIERLSHLAESLLTLARADAGGAIVRRELVDVAVVAHDACRKLAPLSEQQQVSLACDATEPAIVSGDVVALEQVILNLAENAIRYTPSGESAIVRVSTDEQSVILDVTDEGSGIAPVDLPHLFERFYRVDKARSREFGGAGLGLCIVKTFVEAHGGSVQVRSQLGSGSTFTVRLPRERPCS